MRNYKIVASDLDGTLLNNRAEISFENLCAIKELLNKGVYFVPSTGRTLSEIPAEITNNPDIRYFIHSNGAVVYDKKTGHRIFTCISNKLVRKILDIVKTYETHITIRHNGQSFVDAAMQSEAKWDYYNVCEAHRAAVRDFAIYSDEFEKISFEADNVEVISVFFHNYNEKILCKKLLEENECLRAVEADKFNIEIVNINAGKGNALLNLADLLGIDRLDTISIGDSDNDRSITQTAGLGLAVGNACDSLKEVADDVICTNEEHAVAYVTSHYFHNTK